MERKSGFLNKKINTSSVVQQVIDALTGAILNKELRPGDKVPTELELCESLGVGRLSIREAVKVLVYYGVLEIRRPEGTFVCKGFSDSLIDPLLYGIILDTDDSYTNIKELRQLMEVGVIKLAITKCQEAEKQLLTQKYENFKHTLSQDPVSVDAVFEADNQFHDAVSQIGGNPLVDKINALVRVLTHDLRYKTVSNMLAIGAGDTLLHAHAQLCEAIFTGNIGKLDELVEHGYFYGHQDKETSA